MVYMKKGQIEMMGLLIIVILLIVVALLFLFLNFNKSEDKLGKFDVLKANNLMNALDKVSLNNGNGGDLIKECCEGNKRNELDDFFRQITNNLDEKASLFVNENKISGSCSEGASSQSMNYGEGCFARVMLCKMA